MNVRSAISGFIEIRDERVSSRWVPLRDKPIRRYVLPYRGLLGLTLIAIAWPASWDSWGVLGRYSFFPLWLGYILTVDSLVLRLKGTSIISRNFKVFLGMFLFAIPLWWLFEGINQFTGNWTYIRGREYSDYRFLVSSWNFSIVIPAIFETTELIGSFGFINRFKNGPKVSASRRALMIWIAVGVISLVALFLWPDFAYPLTWLGLFFLIDPINHMRGQPSILASIRFGDWRLPVALALGTLVCGWFWEMWNFWALPKWSYDFAFFDFGRIFEMPVLGYGGYIPFGLETFAAYHFLRSLTGRNWGSKEPAVLSSENP